MHRSSSFSLLFCFILFFLPFFSCSDPCSVYAPCSVCSTQSSCGWCALSGTCQSGYDNGTSVSSCGTGDYPDFVWSPSLCGACEAAASCGQCELASTNTSKCGYCQDTGMCMLTMAADGRPSYCPSSSPWLVGPSSCSAYCAGLSACGDCANSDECGYCDSAHACVVGDMFGSPSCSSGAWHWQSFECPRYGGFLVASDYNRQAERRGIGDQDRFAVAALIIQLITLAFTVFVLLRRHFPSPVSARSPVPTSFPRPVSLSEFWRRKFPNKTAQWAIMAYCLVLLIFHVAALLVNVWSYVFRDDSAPVYILKAEFGLVTQSSNGDQPTFYPSCTGLATANGQRCGVFKAAAYFSTIFLIVGLICLLVVLFLGVVSPRVCFPNTLPTTTAVPFPASIVLLYRLYFVFTCFGFFVWALCAHVTLLSYFSPFGPVRLSDSWFLIMAALILALPMLVMWKQYSKYYQLQVHDITINTPNIHADEYYKAVDRQANEERKDDNGLRPSRLAEEFLELGNPPPAAPTRNSDDHADLTHTTMAASLYGSGSGSGSDGMEEDEEIEMLQKGAGGMASDEIEGEHDEFTDQQL